MASLSRCKRQRFSSVATVASALCGIALLGSRGTSAGLQEERALIALSRAAADLDDRLLDALRRAHAKATFFCIGEHLRRSADVVCRAAREGHALQIHSWDHRAEQPMLERCRWALESVAGVNPTLYHPPGSSEFLRNGERLRLAVVNPYDYLRPGEPELVRRVLLAAKPGSVVLLHAGVSETIEALPGLIRSLSSRGFAFGVLQ